MKLSIICYINLEMCEIIADIVIIDFNCAENGS